MGSGGLAVLAVLAVLSGEARGSSGTDAFDQWHRTMITKRKHAYGCGTFVIMKNRSWALPMAMRCDFARVQAVFDSN